MPQYEHGTYGTLADSISRASALAGTVCVYVGAAPVNLVRDFSQAVNSPVKLGTLAAARAALGDSRDWGSFGLCEAFQLHFDNTAGNIGPIVAVNVLDPEHHKKEASVTKALSFTSGRASFTSDRIILDTLVLADKVETVDFTIDYNWTTGQVLLDSVGEKLTGQVQATYSEVDPAMVTAEDIIGGVTTAGVYSGLGCVGLIYPELGLIPNLIVCPGWSGTPAVYEAVVKAGTKINGHWDAFVYADLPETGSDGKPLDTIEKAIEHQETAGYTHERSKVFWPRGADNSGRVYHLSVLAAWRTLAVDTDHDGIPMESPSNKILPVVKQYFTPESKNRGFDQERGNELNAVGITTLVYWGGRWVLWGPHTAAYRHGSVLDDRVIFDNSIRMLMHITNSFQREHALAIDRPMTRSMADTIRNREQEKADALAAIGALIGKPVVEFNEADNSTADLVEGNFTWTQRATPTPPFKSGTLRVAYTTEGFDSYFGEEA